MKNMRKIEKTLLTIITTGSLLGNPAIAKANDDSKSADGINPANMGFFVRAGPFISRGELVNELYGPGPEIEGGWDYRQNGVGGSISGSVILLTGNNSFSESRYGFLNRQSYGEAQDLTYLNFIGRIYSSLMNHKKIRNDIIGPYFAVEGRAFALGEKFVVTEESSGVFSGSSYRNVKGLWKGGLGIGAAIGAEIGEENLRFNVEAKHWFGKVGKKEVGGTSVNVGLSYHKKKKN